MRIGPFIRMLDQLPWRRFADYEYFYTFLLHCALSCAVYCNRPCLFVCLFVCLWVRLTAAIAQCLRRLSAFSF